MSKPVLIVTAQFVDDVEAERESTETSRFDASPQELSSRKRNCSRPRTEPMCWSSPSTNWTLGSSSACHRRLR
jgi:hypothetical protein